MPNNGTPKVAVITGASRGLGFALAKQLGLAGVQVVALARTVGGLEELDDAIQKAGGPRAALVPVDLASGHDQLDRLGATLHERFGKLDIFIHAAAMLGTLSPITHADPNEFQRVMNVNATSCYRLFRSLDALLRAANGAKVITMDCDLGDDTVSYWGPFRASKALLQTMTETYARESGNGGISVFSHTPQPMATKLHATAFPGITSEFLATPDDEASNIISTYSLA
ncbi:MAG: SDR family NAD(P)-dependent oxidoreductase [Bdellovibrionales bacterium]